MEKNSPFSFPFIEIPVESIYNFSQEINIRQYSNKYRKVVIHHNNNYLISKIRLVDFVEKNLVINISQNGIEHYKLIPEDPDEGIVLATGIRLSTPISSNIDSKNILNNLKNEFLLMPDDKIKNLLINIHKDGFTESILPIDFVFDYFNSFIEKRVLHLSKKNRMILLNSLSTQISDLIENNLSIENFLTSITSFKESIDYIERKNFGSNNIISIKNIKTKKKHLFRG